MFEFDVIYFSTLGLVCLLSEKADLSFFTHLANLALKPWCRLTTLNPGLTSF